MRVSPEPGDSEHLPNGSSHHAAAATAHAGHTGDSARALPAHTPPPTSSSRQPQQASQRQGGDEDARPSPLSAAGAFNYVGSSGHMMTPRSAPSSPVPVERAKSYRWPRKNHTRVPPSPFASGPPLREQVSEGTKDAGDDAGDVPSGDHGSQAITGDQSSVGSAAAAAAAAAATAAATRRQRSVFAEGRGTSLVKPRRRWSTLRRSAL